MRKTVHIHIGHSKCGSSSIQDFCDAHRDRLLQDDYYYPPTHGVRQHGLVSPTYYRAARETDRSAFYLQQMVHSIRQSPASHIILSCESFVEDDVGCFDAFREFDMRFVYYIRPQDEWLESGCNQRIKEGHLDPLYEQLAERILPGTDFLGNIRKFTDKYGENSIIVRVLDRQVMVGGDLIQDFFHAIGYAPQRALPPSQISNDSLRGDCLRFAAHLALVPLSRDERVRVAAELTVLSQGREKVAVLTANEKARIRELYREQNEEVARKYLREYDQDTVASLFWGGGKGDAVAPHISKAKELQLPLERQVRLFAQLSSATRALVNLKSVHTPSSYDPEHAISYAPLPGLPEEKLAYDVSKLRCAQVELDFAIASLRASMGAGASVEPSHVRKIESFTGRVIRFLRRKMGRLQ